MDLKTIFAEKILNVSNTLSVFRVILLFPFVFLSLDYHESGNPRKLFLLIIIIILSAISDFLDGFLARKWHQETHLGQYLDPLCDKIVSFTSLLVLVLFYSFPVWIFIIFLFREIAGIWLGTFLFFKRGIMGKPNYWGKTGVALIFVTVIWFVATPYLTTVLHEDHFLLYPSVSAYTWLFVTVMGGITYFKTYRKIIFHT